MGVKYAGCKGRGGGARGVRQKGQLVPFNKEVEKEREKNGGKAPLPPLTFDSDRKKTSSEKCAQAKQASCQLVKLAGGVVVWSLERLLLQPEP